MTDRSTELEPRAPMVRHEAFWTHDEEAAKQIGDHLYYFAPANRMPGPYREQRHVEAIIDVAQDGTLAGVELIYSMPPPPVSRAPTHGEISAEVEGVLEKLEREIDELQFPTDARTAYTARQAKLLAEAATLIRSLYEARAGAEREREEWRAHVLSQNSNVSHNLARAEAASPIGLAGV